MIDSERFKLLYGPYLPPKCGIGDKLLSACAERNYGLRPIAKEDEGVEAKLVSESWYRVSGGSGQRHEIASAGSQLVEEGFV